MNEKQKKLLDEIVDMLADEFSEWVKKEDLKFEIDDMRGDDCIYITFRFDMWRKKQSLTIRGEGGKWFVYMPYEEYEEFNTYCSQIKYLYLALLWK